LIVYFDSSAFVKLVLEEEGSDIALELWKSASDRVTSQVAYPEARAALAAARRSRRIDDDALVIAVTNLEGARRALRMLNVDATLAQRAGDLAERYALRGYDAVHLATMVSLDAARVLTATWDKELALAASQCGLGVVPSAPRWNDERAGDRPARSSRQRLRLRDVAQ
jgi:uncharacterized protein